MSRIIDFSKAGNSNGAQTNGLRSNLAGTAAVGTRGTNIMFPHDLDDQHYMTFRVVESVREKAAVPTKRVKKRSIILPVPGNLVAKYASDWENSDMGTLASIASGKISMEDIQKAGADAKSAMASMGSEMMKGGSGKMQGAAMAAGAVAGLALSAKYIPGALGKAAGVAAALVGGDKVLKGVMKQTEIAINPHQAVLFKGITFKEHSFNFKFIPRTVGESEDIQELCRIFRYHMLPGYKFGGMAFTYPDEFQIIFSHHLSPYLFDIGNCVLKSFDVTYNGSGVPSFSKDGAPMEVDISLGFQEINIETRDTSNKQSPTMFMASGFGHGKRPGYP
jgi:outer membrane lipoprotein SlyB